MKIKILYAIGFWCILSVACQENEMTDFENDGAVYFQLNATYWAE